MSMRAIKWPWLQDLLSTHKLVLMALADLADETGHCCPSVSTLAAQCGVSSCTVRRALRDLTTAQLSTADARIQPDGSTTSNLYTLSVADAAVVALPRAPASEGLGASCMGPMT